MLAFVNRLFWESSSCLQKCIRNSIGCICKKTSQCQWSLASQDGFVSLVVCFDLLGPKFLMRAGRLKKGAGGGYHSHSRTAPPAPTKNIAELAIATPQLSTLLAAVKAAGLVDTLAGDGPFTVFAPTNDAFAKIPEETLNGLLADKDALTAVLLRHVVPGAALKAKEVPKGTTTLKTAGGEEIDVTRGKYITVKSSSGEAGVIAFDVLATNGVVHLVNSVF